LDDDDDLPQTQKPKHPYLFWCFILLWESPMFPLKAQGEELLKARGYEQKYPPKPVEAKEMLMGLEGLDGCFVREKRKGNDGRKWRKRCLFLGIFGLVFRLILPRLEVQSTKQRMAFRMIHRSRIPYFFIDPQRCCGRSSSTRFHGFPLFKGISSINSKFG